jgi:phospholipid/cholesterol/gamma-HCH transport system substrate-binding protein
MKITNEAKTGFLVLVCLLALSALILKVGNFNLFQNGYTGKCDLHHSGGGKKHAPVRLSGVDVGEVKDIRILYGSETLVELGLWLRDDVKIYLDSTAYVTTLGLMGEKYIEIKAGTASAGYAKEGDLIKGDDPVRLEELVKLGTQVAGDVSQMAKDISKVAASVNETVKDNRKKIDHIVDNVDETSENFREFSQDIKYHPWKILVKGKEKTAEEIEQARETRKKLKCNFNKK